jgi:hypothetical protein
MSRERWGTFAVNDHLRKNPFAADVLMYDRLIIPRPEGPAEKARWAGAEWEPDELDRLLEVLRVDAKEESKRRATTVPWNEYTRDLFKRRAETAQIVDQEANYGLTRRLLATELQPAAPAGVIPISVVTAYPSDVEAQNDWVPNEFQNRAETLTMALAHQFLVPEPEGRTDTEVLKEAVKLTDEADFRKKRQQLYDCQEDVIRRGIADDQALEEMAEYVQEYNRATEKAVNKVYVKFAFTLVPVAITALAGPLAPAVGAGAIANLTRQKAGGRGRKERSSGNVSYG